MTLNDILDNIFIDESYLVEYLQSIDNQPINQTTIDELIQHLVLSGVVIFMDRVSKGLQKWLEDTFFKNKSFYDSSLELYNIIVRVIKIISSQTENTDSDVMHITDLNEIITDLNDIIDNRLNPIDEKNLASIIILGVIPNYSQLLTEIKRWAR